MSTHEIRLAERMQHIGLSPTMKGTIDVQPMNVPGEFTATKAK